MSRPLLAGANPFVTLYADGVPTAYASVWRVDWSVKGSGAAIILWHAGMLRILSDAPELAAWVEAHFVRHFEEATALRSWPECARVEREHTRVRVDPASGAFASAGDVSVRVEGVLDARPVGIEDFPLKGVSHGLSMLVLPCERATISVGGSAVPGSPQVSWDFGTPSSSAVVTVHEAWSM